MSGGRRIPFLIVSHLLEPFPYSWVVCENVCLVEAFLEHGWCRILLQDVVTSSEASHFGEIASAARDNFG